MVYELCKICNISLSIITNKNFILKLTISEKTKPDRWAITVMGIICFFILIYEFYISFYTTFNKLTSYRYC